MRAGVFQFAPRFGDREGNLARIEDALARERADLWVLPELATTGYQFRSTEEAREHAEEYPAGPSIRRIAGLSRALDTAIVCGFPEREGERVFNSAFLAERGECRTLYRKAHLFADEFDVFTPGDSGFRTIDACGIRLGILICFDWRFPEPWRMLALQGADCVAHPSNLVRPHAPEAMRTRALENGFFLLTADRVGTEERIPGRPIRFIGLSQCLGRNGDVLFRMGEEEGTRVAEFDPVTARDKKRGRNDLLADRRTELYRL